MLFIVSLAGTLLTYLTMRYFLHYSGSTIFNVPSSLLSENALLGYIWTYIGSYIPVFAAVFFGSSAISGEIESKSAYSVFPLPVSRTTLICGKYLASLLVGLLIVLYYYAFFAVNSVLVLHTVDLQPFLLSLGLSALFLSAILSMAFLVSSIFNRATYSYVTVFLVYFLIFSALNYVIQLLYKYFPFYLLDNTSTIISRVFFNFNFSNLTFNLSINPLSADEILLYAAVMLAYSIISLLIAIFIFQEKEVK